MSLAVQRETWFDQVRRAEPSSAEVAEALGLHVRRLRFGPCPACNEDDPRHPPITVRAGHKGWMCAHCKATGDAVRLVAWVLTGGPKPSGSAWSAVRSFFASHGWCEPEGTWTPAWTPTPRTAPPPGDLPYPDGIELGRLLRTCRPVVEVPDVAAYVRNRGFSLPIPAAVLPDVYPWPRWWGFGRERTWRLVVAAVDASGAVRSMHARAVPDVGRDLGNTRWPAGAKAAGLLFADPAVARPMLRGQAAPTRVLVVEGITDYLAACSRRPADVAVLGATSGGFGALGSASIPAHAVVYVGTDNDAAGDRYAEEVKRCLPGRDLRRVRWARGE